jgi:5-methylcytosine-specific restriction protein B
MSNSSDGYTVDETKEDIGILRRVAEDVVEAIENAESEEVLEYLIENQELDRVHDGERGLGQVRRAVLESPLASDRLKRIVSLRGDKTPDVRVYPQNDFATLS